MKIMIVNNARKSSGCEDHCVDLALWFRANGVEPVFLISEQSVMETVLPKLGIRYHTVFIPGRKSGLIGRIMRAIAEERPDVVSVNREHNIIPTFIAAKLASLFMGVRTKLAAVFHTPTGRWYPLLRKFDGIICTSDYTAQSFFKANTGISGMTEIIHYGVTIPPADLEAKRPSGRERRVFAGRSFPIIGMVGELWKNQEELVDIAPRLVERFPQITIAFIGGYDITKSLREKIEASGLKEHFVLTGRLPRERMADAFFDLDLSVSTHRNEGFGIVHIESLASYTPVVAYNSGGLVEIIREGGGVLVDGGGREFADAVIGLLSDDAKRLALGIEGRKVVEEKFSVDAMGRRHLAFYERLVSGRRS